MEFKKGDVIHFKDGGRYSEDCGVVTSRRGSWVYAIWYNKDTHRVSDNGDIVHIHIDEAIPYEGPTFMPAHKEQSTEQPVVNSVQEAIDFLIAQGYTVSLAKTSTN